MFVVQGRMKSRRFQALSPGQGGGFVQIRTFNTKDNKTTFESKMSWARMKEKNLIMNEPFPRFPSLCLTRGGGGGEEGGEWEDFTSFVSSKKVRNFGAKIKTDASICSFFSEKTTEKVKEMATVKYFFIIPCDKN